MPPHPSGPHDPDEHVGTQLHWPPELHADPSAHVPQVPPHPSEPQIRPLQSDVQPHCPEDESHNVPLGHVPHDPPQPSSPHARPTQLGAQTHCPLASHAPEEHVPQSPPQP